MCFHTSNTKKAIQLEDRFEAKFEDVSVYEPYYHLNGFDFGYVYIITQEEEDSIEPAKWGLLPEDFTDASGFRKSFNTLNARSERAFESTMYREPLQERRCLILADGFFESKHVNGKTYPHFIRYKSYEPFAFAGMYNKHNEGEYSCSILTTEANPFMAEIHNSKKRMPLILDNVYENKWLSNSITDSEIKDLMDECFTKQKLEAYTVSKDVTNSRIKSNRFDILNNVNYEDLNTLF
ncbi:SOS response-associated peptidase [Olleya sp. AH-315-F22]|nr:SOS response-associated peptidase [Olleya sp. AH-315-F22]